MIMKKLLILLLTLSTTVAWGQNDAKSRNILSRLSKNYRTYKTIEADVAFTIDNRKENIKENQKGRVFMKGQKFRLELGEQTLICDGKTLWTYLKEVNEVTVSPFEPAEGELSPTNLFTIYEKGFESYYIGESNRGKNKVHTIDIVPTDKKKSFFKIRLVIDRQKEQIVQAVVFDKNGSLYTYNINNFKTNSGIADATFAFDKKQFPGVEVVDLR
jgi:outer membrane lipoprotein-sorting protein